MTKKKKKNIKRFVIKVLLSLIYLSIIMVLVYSSYSIFTEERKIVEWKDVEKTSQYTYLEIYQMSEAFAKIDNKQVHFVMEKEETGIWHTYLIAISENDYNKYKEIIDYTYERTTTSPGTIKVYGYPVEIPKEIKTLAIKNITNFVPIENEVVINEKNFDEYLTNTYLDATIGEKETFNYYVLILLVIALTIFLVLIYTIFDTDKNKKIQSKNKNMKNRKTKKSFTNQTEKTIKEIKNSDDDTNSVKKQKKDQDIEII